MPWLLALALALAGCSGDAPPAGAWLRATDRDSVMCASRAGERVVLARKDGTAQCLSYLPLPGAPAGRPGVITVADAPAGG